MKLVKNTKWPFSVLTAIFFLLALCSGCEGEQPKQAIEKRLIDTHIKDPHSFSDPNAVAVSHMHLDLYFDFQKETVMGTVTYSLDRKSGNELILDVNNLNIHKVFLKDKDEGTGLDYTVSDPDPILGSALTISLPEDVDEIRILYSTNPSSAALQWLKPEQTADKALGFVYTQGQAILTRTWIPCQDSPGSRITYSAEIQVQPGMMALMSAENPIQNSADGSYEFKMKQPIPPYLIALAAGQLTFASLGENTGVYAEQSMIDKSAYEFGEMQDMLSAAEALYGPYQWDRYDVLVLPPSFPFGGMENPRLTFATPTILAGDRSLTALIAHELAHSWSGNLVTNATWNDFWLNEGFTVYFERRIMEALYGTEYTNMLALLGYQDLEFEVEDLGKHSHDTHLKLSLEGRDPDDGMTDIAYEKGAYLLVLLESKVGREKFDEFLKTYFEENKFQTMTTERFIAYVQRNLIKPEGIDIDLDEWIFGPGIPENIILPKSDKFEIVEAEIENVINGKMPHSSVVATWSTHEWLHFIRHLPTDFDKAKMTRLDHTFGFSNSGNSEILAAWFELAINNGYGKTIMSDIESFLINVGRRKFLTPLYRALKSADMLDEAQSIYAKARPNYHSVSRGTLETILEL